MWGTRRTAGPGTVIRVLVVPTAIKLIDGRNVIVDTGRYYCVLIVYVLWTVLTPARRHPTMHLERINASRHLTSVSTK